jgi:hypothetical protein
MSPKTSLLPAVLLPAALLLAACASQPAGAPATTSAPAAGAAEGTSVPVPDAESGSAAAAPSAGTALPPGVQRVVFGTSYKPRSATGVPRCGIRDALPEPVTFQAGAREVTWVALVDTAVVADLRGTVVGDPGGAFAMEPCEVYTVCGSGACRVQYGAVLRREDGQPLRPGPYRLEIEVTGQKATLPFTVAATPALEAAPAPPAPGP